MNGTTHIAECPGHCWHIVGVLKQNRHGPFAPQLEKPTANVHRCCECGRHETITSSRNILPEEIDFAPDCEPKEGATA